MYVCVYIILNLLLIPILVPILILVLTSVCMYIYVCMTVCMCVYMYIHLCVCKKTFKPFFPCTGIGDRLLRGGFAPPPPGAEACARCRCATPKARSPGFQPACSRGASGSFFRLLRKQVSMMKGCPASRTRKAVRCPAFPSWGVAQQQRVHCGGARGVP